MSAEQYNTVEQDSQNPPGGNELPSYDDLATQNGPNSRYRKVTSDLTTCTDLSMRTDLGGGGAGLRKGTCLIHGCY